MHMLRAVPLVLALVLAGWLAWDASRTPTPLPASAPATAFSAGRAFADVEVIGARAHPTGSPENAKVRDWLAGRMRALGLQVRVQPGQAVALELGGGEPSADAARIENVIGVLPGRNPALPALLVMAHYDSVPASPGASDDGAGVASALETARALKASGAPARDVIFLMTDGEEAGLMGARAFFAGDPLARRVGAVLNMDVRGDGGRVMMFETGWGDGATLERLKAERTDATTNSLTGFIYAVLPNDTDFTVAKARGLPGLNFAYIGRQFGYHAAASTPEDLDRGALQHMGEQVLAAARDLSGPAPFPAKAPDVVYSDLLGRGVVLYPVWAGWLVLVAAAGLWVFAARRAAKFEPFSVMGLLRGAAAVAGLTLAIVPLGDFVRRLTGAPFGFVGERPLLAQFTPYEAALAAITAAVVLAAAFALDLGQEGRPRGRFALAAVPFLAGIACTFLGGLDLPALGCGTAAGLLAAFASGRPVPAWSGWTGAWILAFAASLVLQITAPVTAFVFAWPLLAASLTAWLIAFTAKARFSNLAAVAAAIAVGVLVTAELAAFAHLLIVGVGSSLPEAIAPIAFLTALVLYPLTRLFAEARAAGWAAAVALIAALGLAAFIRLHPYASPRTPAASEVLAIADTARGRFYRASPLPRLGAWSRSVLAGGGQDLRSAPLPPISTRPIFLTEAEPFGFTPVVSTFGPDALVEPPHVAPYAPTQDGHAVPLRKYMESVGAFTEYGATDLAGPRLFTVFVPPGVEVLHLDLKTSAPVADVRLNDEPVALLTKPGEWSHLTFTAPRGGGVSIRFTPKAHGKLEARWAAFTPGWPAGASLPPRPADVMPWMLSDSTVVLGATRPGEGRF
jgi:hypothetical protein